MKKMNSLLGAVCVSALTLSLSSSAMAAFVIDDFNVGSTSIVSDNTTGGGAITGPSIIDGANIVMNGAGWTRDLTANLTAGDEMETEVCSNCQAGHVNMLAGNSTGVGTITYTGGPAVDMSAYNRLGFDWGATEAGASVDIIFSDGISTTTAASWSSLADTGGSAPGDLVTQALMNIAFGAVDPTAITEVQFVVNGVQNMNSIFDNVEASVVPVPAAVWLFGSGLLGLIGVARKKT